MYTTWRSHGGETRKDNQFSYEVWRQLYLAGSPFTLSPLQCISPDKSFEECKILSHSTQATVGGSPFFGPIISVARGHSRE